MNLTIDGLQAEWFKQRSQHDDSHPRWKASQNDCGESFFIRPSMAHEMGKDACELHRFVWAVFVFFGQALVLGVSHCKNVQPNHSRGKLAAQGIQILFSWHQIGPHIGPHWQASSDGRGIIGGQRGCLHFRRLHQ